MGFSGGSFGGGGGGGGGSAPVVRVVSTLPGFGLSPHVNVDTHDDLSALQPDEGLIVEIASGPEIAVWLNGGWIGPFFPDLVKNPPCLAGAEGEDTLILTWDGDLPGPGGPIFEALYDDDAIETVNTKRNAVRRSNTCLPVIVPAALAKPVRIINARPARYNWVAVFGLAGINASAGWHFLDWTASGPGFNPNPNTIPLKLAGRGGCIDVHSIGQAILPVMPHASGLADAPARYLPSGTDYQQYLGTYASSSTGVQEWDYDSRRLVRTQQVVQLDYAANGYTSISPVGSGDWCLVTVADGPTSWSFFPERRVVEFTLEITNGGLFTQTWPPTVRWPGGSPPSLTVAGTDLLRFSTHDQGTSWYCVFTALNV
jgi:hypothetical protein